MKHLIETTDSSSLTRVDYDRIILDSTTNEIVCKGGGVTYEYVDLGLPSRLKWAKCNIGAEKETDFGGYFMWGSTTPNTASECNWANAPFNGGNTSYSANAFNQVKDTACPNGILAKKYDAAAQIMGGDWRMPTQDEFQELLDNTDNEWVDNFNNSGVNGWKFTSKTDTSKYIFIPAAGYCNNGSVQRVGYHGDVLSSSLYTLDPRVVRVLSFGSDDGYYIYISGAGSSYRYLGRPVRGVRK